MHISIIFSIFAADNQPYVKLKIITIMARPNRGSGSNGVKRPSTNTNRHQYGNGGKKSC